MKKANWTPDEDRRLRRMVEEHKPIEVMARILGKSEMAVYLYAYRHRIALRHTVKNHTCIEINISSNQPFFHLTPEFITTHVRKHQFLWFHFIQYFFCHGRRAVYIIRTLRILTCMHADYQSKLSSIGNNSLITDIVKISISVTAINFNKFLYFFFNLIQLTTFVIIMS